MLGGLHAAYGYHFPNGLYLGGEGYFNFCDQDMKGEGLSLNHKEYALTKHQKVSFKKRNPFGFKFRPGFVSGNTLFYGVIGYESAQFKTKISEKNKQDRNHDFLSNAFVLGVGVAFYASDEIIVGLEATHSIYEKKDNDVAKASVRSTDAFLRLSYKL